MISHSLKTWFALRSVLLLALLLTLVLSCRTVELLTGSTGETPRAERTSTAQRPTRAAPTKTPVPSRPLSESFAVVGTPKCGVGDDTESIVAGTITEGGIPLVGQMVQAASGPGAEPISEFPAVADEQGRFQVTFICDGSACNGAFWVWLVDEEFRQVSPFVKFVFDQRCRRGTVDFQKR